MSDKLTFTDEYKVTLDRQLNAIGLAAIISHFDKNDVKLTEVTSRVRQFILEGLEKAYQMGKESRE